MTIAGFITSECEVGPESKICGRCISKDVYQTSQPPKMLSRTFKRG